MSSLLVTGATGFLGEHLCRVLVEQGHTVRGLARTRSAVLAELGVEHIRGDVLGGPELDRALTGTASPSGDAGRVAAVFHLAGAVSRDPDDAQRMMRLHV
ncbi:MAG: NAD-dependent epimerase/dehydratase family protein, partial [Myxococcales bacterium]|nr:NAD-dependent epimerase/dehydratase family protein [Myxococcales bacterium]